jgi:RNA recognition motif-containing protein
MGQRIEDLYPNTTLFMCNIPYEMTEPEIVALLPHKTEILRTSFPSGVQRSRGFGFVSYSSQAICLEAVQILNKMEVKGRFLVCRLANASNPEIRQRDAFPRPPPGPYYRPALPQQQQPEAWMGRFGFDPYYQIALPPQARGGGMGMPELAALERKPEQEPDLSKVSTEELKRLLATRERDERSARCYDTVGWLH